MLPVAITLPVPKLATLALPVAFNVPVMLAPVVVTTSMLAKPPTEVLTFPLTTGIDTLDVPFESVVPIGILVSKLPSPWKKLAVARLPKLALPDDILPVAITLMVPKLRTLAFQVAFNVPAILAPVPVITTTFAVPPRVTLILPLLTGIDTLDVPFERDVPIGILVSKLPSPWKKLAVARLPKLAFPVTAKLPKVPTDVRLEVVIPEARVEPVKLAALAAITTLLAAVN